jgi:hypothetical protein
MDDNPAKDFKINSNGKVKMVVSSTVPVIRLYTIRLNLITINETGLPNLA